MDDVPGLDLTKPHIVHQEHAKVQVYDQGGHLYDGVTQRPLDHSSPKKLNALKEKYAIVDGAPFMTVKTTAEKVQDVIATIRASGSVDPDNLAKFERLFKNMLIDQEQTVVEEAQTSFQEGEQ